MADRFTERDGNVLVFEDDVVIQPGFLDRLPKLLDILASRQIRDIDGLWSFGDLPDVLEHYVVYTGLCWHTDLASDIRPRGAHRLRWKLRRTLAACRFG